MTETIKFSMSLPQGVWNGLQMIANDNEQTVNDCIREILTRAVKAAGHLPPDEEKNMEIYRRLSRQVADAAEAIMAELGTCPPDITPRAVARCQDDADWFGEYQAYINGDPFARGNPRKHNINPNFGYVVKQRLGASNCKTDKGRDQVLKVTGQPLVITSYTALEVK
ncbi:hypothetical protein [Frigidibacter mobilis]|uniref:Uncharacterized protein n=1 Tax=Frigidibacter mobilis TaxID=1335048 RepID=A0A159YYW4_9RHOB|nr:hypothetical protein [Frigidibacter mobilis]AMY67706.1 hypothetical protein AKL17_0445 [Frigidibacter mobilis]